MFTTPKEAMRLLDAIDPFFKPLVYIAITTGLRWSEFAGLQLQDVVLDGPEPRLTVNQGLHNTSTRPKYEKPKSTAGHRTIPLTEIQTTLIKSHFAATADHRNGDATHPLFMAKNGGSINYSNFRNRYFEPALYQVALMKTRFHDLRRTVATLLSNSQVDLKTIQTMMGHSDVRMTLNVYATTSSENLRKASAKIRDQLKTG